MACTGFEGNEGLLGKAYRPPYFSNDLAPALCGWDEAIDDFCFHERETYQGARRSRDASRPE